MDDLRARMDAEEFTRNVFAFAQLHDMPSDVLVAGLADTLGMVAATLDAHTGAQPFGDRMAVVFERAQQSYRDAKLKRQAWLAKQGL